MNEIIKNSIIEILTKHKQPYQREYIAFINNIFIGNYTKDDIRDMIESILLQEEKET